MMKLIKLMMFGLLIFAVSAGGSWFALTKQHAVENAEDANPHDVVVGADPHAGDSHSGDSHGETHDAAAEQEILPVVVRPKMLTPEDILRNAMGLKEREAKLTQRERAAEQEQLRLQLAQSDLQGEQTSIDALAADVKAQIEEANVLLVRISDEFQQLESKRQQNADEIKKFEETRTEMNAGEQQNLKQLSLWIQGMEANGASEFIKELSKNGQMDVAVRLLANFEERKASEILAALNDPGLMADLAEKFRTLQRPTKTATNKR